jgi:hypothetical protein
MDILCIKEAPPPSSGGELWGTVDLSKKPGEKYEHYGVFPFIWTESPGIQGWPIGWKPATSNPIPLRDDGSWYIHVAPARQYAAILVYEDFGAGFDHTEPFAPGTLPQHAVEAWRISARKKVVILTVPDGPLTGLITGYPCALYDPERLSPDRPATEAELLKVVAWSRTNGQSRLIDEVRCEPSGYWIFPELKQDVRDADEYFVAFAPSSYMPRESLPAIGADVWDMAWETHTPRPPLTRAAGQTIRQP